MGAGLVGLSDRGRGLAGRGLMGRGLIGRGTRGRGLLGTGWFEWKGSGLSWGRSLIGCAKGVGLKGRGLAGESPDWQC